MKRISTASIFKSPVQAYEIRKYFNILSFILQLLNKFLFKVFLLVVTQKNAEEILKPRKSS